MSLAADLDSKASGRGRIIWASMALVAIVLATRAPFLDAGYGASVDAWRMAATARHIAETGEYVVSRFPGYPLHEYASALVVRGGPWALNGLNALACAAAALFFYWYLRSVNGPAPWWSALTLAFVPVVFVESTSAKDYLTALAFLMAALLAAGAKRSLVAGLLLGLAIGFRPASIVLGLPLAMILVGNGNDGRKQILELGRFAVATAVTALLAFAPVIYRYGWGFLQGYPHEEPWTNALRNATTDYLGLLGCLGLLFAVGAALVFRGQGTTAPRNHVLAWISGVLVVAAVFIAIPYQAGYLIPATPFVILLLGHFAPRWAFFLFCGLTILSSAVDLNRAGVAPGAIFANRAKRLDQIRGTENFVAEMEKISGRLAFVVGGQHALVSVLHPELTGFGEHRYVYLLDRREAQELVQRGYSLVCSEEVRRANIVFHDVDLVEFGAVVYDAKPAPGKAP